MIDINSYDIMIEKYRHELMNASKRSVFPQHKTDTREPSVQTVAEVAPIQTDTPPQPQMTTPPESSAPSGADTSYGTLRVEVFAADRAYAVPSATVTVSETDNPDTILFNGLTDTSGMLGPIRLNTPSPIISTQPGNGRGYASYDILVTHPRYRTQRFIGVPVFAGVESVQPVRMQPLGKDNTDIIIFEREPSNLTQSAQTEE